MANIYFAFQLQSANMISLYSFLCLAVTVFICLSAEQPTPGERELRKDLFRDYDKYSRPVKDHTAAVPVNVSLALLSLKNLHVKSQLIILDTWMKLKWVDEYLTWNPAEYDNITMLLVSPSQVWRPDISLYTASPMDSLFPIAQTEILLYNSGTVMWVPPFTISSRCPMPYRNYITSEKPFIECNIRMGSWTSSEKMLDLQLGADKVDLTNFQDYNYEWKLVKVVSDRESKIYPCCPDAYPFVDFNVTLKKRNYYLRPGNDD